MVLVMVVYVTQEAQFEGAVCLAQGAVAVT